LGVIAVNGVDDGEVARVLRIVETETFALDQGGYEKGEP